MEQLPILQPPKDRIRRGRRLVVVVVAAAAGESKGRSAAAGVLMPRILDRRLRDASAGPVLEVVDKPFDQSTAVAVVCYKGSHGSHIILGQYVDRDRARSAAAVLIRGERPQCIVAQEMVEFPRNDG